MSKTYFIDTYAWIEMHKLSKAYMPYTHGAKIITSKLNLLEFSFVLQKEQSTAKAKEIFDTHSRYCVDYDDKILFDAAEMKFKHLKERISFIDCIGYLLAKKHKAKFLTGDEHFRDMSNVEFIK